MRLSTVFLGIIAAVMLGAAGVWWGSQPSREELRREEAEQRMQDFNDAMDDFDRYSRIANSPVD